MYKYKIRSSILALMLCAATLEAGADEGGSSTVIPVEKFHIDRFEVTGNTLLDVNDIQSLLRPYTGEGRTYSDIQYALEALENAYRAAGYSAVNVYTPEQEISNGVIRLEATESVIGVVRLVGHQHFDTDNIRAALPALQEGYIPNARKLSENVRLANQNPSRQMDVALSLGREENTVDATVKIKDQPPAKFLATVDNTGNSGTGMYRVGVGFQHNNLFNRDHAMTLTYTTSPGHISEVKQISASYRLPLYELGDSLDFLVAHSNVIAGTATTVAGPLDFSGRGNIYGVRYNHYLPRQGEFSAKIVGSFDWRILDNECALGVFGAAGCGAAASDVTVHPLGIGYEGEWQGVQRIATAFISYTRNLPFGKNGRQADFDAVRPSPLGGKGAAANYDVLRMGGSVAGQLAQSWQYRVAANSQYTRDALIPSEKLGLVGTNAVRGYLEREFASDKGVVLNLEIYTPDLAPALGMDQGSLRLLGFVDRAKGWDVLLPGETSNTHTVGSYGLGMRFALDRHISLKLDLARVTATGSSSKSGDMRGVLGLVASW